MNVNELVGLTAWIQNEIVDAEIPHKYQQLQTLLQQNAQPNQQNTQFDIQKEDLLTALRAIHTTSLSNDQVTFLSKLGIEPLIGETGADAIEDILYKNVIDVATAAQKFAELSHALNEGIQKSSVISQGLTGLVDFEDEDVVDGVLMRVSFLGDAAMNNLSDFKKWGETWFSIGRGVAQAHDAAPEDITIIGAAKGSVIIELMAAAKIAATVSGIILSALLVAEKVYDLRKKAAEVRLLDLQSKKLANDIEKAAEDEKKAEIELIVKEQIKLLGLKPKSDGERINALKKSITDLVEFINDGGEIDFVAPEEEYDDEEEDKVVDDGFIQIREQAQSIRRLENKLRLLEDKSEGVEDEQA